MPMEIILPSKRKEIMKRSGENLIYIISVINLAPTVEQQLNDL
jgi:hypothetical protein